MSKILRISVQTQTNTGTNRSERSIDAALCNTSWREHFDVQTLSVNHQISRGYPKIN